MDIENPAVAINTILTPKDVAVIRDDPASMELVARAMGAVNLDNLFRQMQAPDINPATKIEFQKLLNRMGKLEPELKSSGGAGPQVVINITRAKDRDDSLTIEGLSQLEPTG